MDLFTFNNQEACSFHPTNSTQFSVKSRQPLDYITVGVISLGLIPFIAGNVVMVKNKDYLPIKTKSVELTVVSSIGGVIWLLSCLVVNNHFGRPKDTIWSVCSLWTFWMQACFGFALWLNCLILRLINLYFILVLRRPVVKWSTVAVLMLLSPIIVFSICASALHASSFKPASGNCSVGRGWSIGLLIIIPFYFCCFLGLGILLRNVRSIFNEYRLIVNGGMLALFFFLLTLVTIQTKVYQEPAGRCFLVLAVSGTVFYYFFARNWEALYHSVFNREEYLERFLAQLNSVPSRSHNRNFENPAEMMLFDAREERRNLHDEVQELDQQLTKLVEQYKKERGSITPRGSVTSSLAPSREESFK
ncbi:hypothetical protein MPTK1_1g05640 [Marchantia polymorpha subsp. ruderalis]|nr:hypothetical protein MARPO_0005s0043 [Marchantia polymorpha]BBM97432.1 hypothetical protein Mp_1g05640 [Marchantia polymorpha subsp. ruderalis]|eukprot:PTQ48371.1 hypothetical protein MARPO_0005s0043 [Marchantia polymorpha]